LVELPADMPKETEQQLKKTRVRNQQLDIKVDPRGGQGLGDRGRGRGGRRDGGRRDDRGGRSRRGEGHRGRRDNGHRGDKSGNR